MPTTPATQRPRADAILYVDRDGVEWFDRSEPSSPRYARVATRGAGAAAVAEAAAEALHASGGPARPCVLVLSDALVGQRLVQVPDAPRRTLREVFLRKAAPMARDERSDVLFTGTLVDRRPADGETPTELRTWLLTVVGREEMLRLRDELRRRRFRVLAVRTGGQAGACRAWSSARAGEPASIAVTVGPHATRVALVCGDRLAAQYSLEGNYLHSLTLGAGLLRDVRNAANFWRRVSRGGDVDRVVVIGLDGERGRTLAESIASMLGDVPVEWEPRYAGLPAAGRMELLCACLEGGPFHPDLTRALPLPPQRLASTVAIVAALVLLASVFVSARVRRATDLRRAETNLLVTSTDGLESLENELARARADVRALGSRLDRTASALDGGIALGRLMSATDASLRGRAELVALRAHRTDDGEHRLEIGGRVDPEPLRMVAALTAAARDLEAALGLDDVRIHPPVAVPEPGAATSVPFTLEGTLEGTLDRGLPRGGSTAPEGGR